MGRITVELLRRRAEHNEGCLSDLQEIALHQQDIEAIELIGDACRQLEILYLCNNYISRIEGLVHLKKLKYINLAVNNIRVIEGLSGCEALEKLDLTLNFVEDLTCVNRLRANAFLITLHLTGNPCTKLEGYRAYVIHALPQLHDLDGETIVRSERIVARQDDSHLNTVATAEAVRVREEERLKEELIAKGIDPFPPKFNEKGERLYGYSPEERLQMLRESEREAEERKKKNVPTPGSISAIHEDLNKKPVRLTPEQEKEKYGRLLIRNEGKLAFTLSEDGEPGNENAVVVKVQPGKFISTTLINVDVQIDYVRVTVKDKLLQIPLSVEVSPSQASVQRSTTTGELKITAPYAADVLTAKQKRFKMIDKNSKEDECDAQDKVAA